MSPTLIRSFYRARVAIAALLVMLATPMLARSEAIPRPEGIQQDVNFWIRVYTEVTTNEGFLHDERNLGVIYDTLKFSAGSSSRDRQRVVDERRDRHIAALRRIIAALPTEATREALSADDKRLLAMWGPNPSAIILRDATARIRFQLGQADRFREGLIRSSSWSTHIAETYANQGLPPELAVLPRTRRWAPRASGSSCDRRVDATCGLTTRSTNVSTRIARPRRRPNYWPITTACSAAGRWRSRRTTMALRACGVQRNPSARTTTPRSTVPTAAVRLASRRAISFRHSLQR